ncbi:hypothetical protein DF185_21875 [Marinifilum breve]|uniref:Uncharacterized protein n=1 Tax=Marinifilum breve TaxID=2184082 RepID=A0A2V3ZS87_9BACT|nr:hypothetical protein [Marinifilum breve]PXX95744.1 hypothetical protein DF185_21875 [Marinifilum breve]
MSFIIKDSIEKLLEEVIKSNNTEKRARKRIELKSILKIINSIELSSDFKGVKKISRLPIAKTDFSEFRVIDDTDSDDRSFWIEL